MCRLLRVSGRRTVVSPYVQGSLNSVIVLMPELFGDVIMTTPLIRALGSIAPAAEIIVAGSGPGVRLLSHDDLVTQAIDLREVSKQERRALFARRYDVLLSTKDHPSFTNLRLVRQFKAGYRIGFDHLGHKGFFNCLVARPEQMPAWEKVVGLVENLGSPSSVSPYLPGGPVSPAIKEFVASELARWSELLSDVTGPFVVLAAPEHSADRRELESGLSGAIPSPATESLFDVGEIVRHSSVLLSTDTAAVHVASCFDTPVLALYRNPRDLAKFPPLSKHNHVLLALDDDLTSISVAEVREGLDSLKRELP